MAKFDFSAPSEFIRQLGKMSEIDEYIPAMLKGAAPILEKKLRQELSKYQDTGAMVKSIKTSVVKIDRYGTKFISVGPTGKDPITGVRNVEKFAILEYGKSDQAARPMVDRISAETMPEILEKMREIFYEAAGIKK